MDKTDTHDAYTLRGDRPARWGDAAIIATLQGLLDDLGRTGAAALGLARYPYKRDFCDAGLGGLRRTIQSRPGGASAFAARVGCLPPLRGRPAARPTPRSIAAPGAR